MSYEYHLIPTTIAVVGGASIAVLKSAYSSWTKTFNDLEEARSRITELEEQLDVNRRFNSSVLDSKDERIAQLEGQLNLKNYLQQGFSDFYDLLQEEAKMRIAELEAENSHLYSITGLAKLQTMDIADYYAEPTNTEPTTIDQNDEDWPF